jgi:hypothetical protein
LHGGDCIFPHGLGKRICVRKASCEHSNGTLLTDSNRSRVLAMMEERASAPDNRLGEMLRPEPREEFSALTDLPVKVA